jgi:hypothetical protein
VAVLLLIGAGYAPTPARADYIFTAIGTNPTSGDAINAVVDINFSGGVMTVKITNNLTSNNEQIGSAVTGISITTVPTLSSTTLTNTYGNLRNTTGFVTETNNVLSTFTGASYFDGGTGVGHNSLASSPWSVTSNNPGTISVFGDGSPDGSVAGSGSLGSSLTNSAHMPVFSNSVTLVANVTPTDIAGVSGVTFQFGTNQSEGYVNGTPVLAPAPPSLALALSGFGGLALVSLWRRRRKAIAAV